MTDPLELLQQAGATVGALSVVVGAAWWLIGPRLLRQLDELKDGAHQAQEQLQPGRPGSTAANAAQAARAAAEVPRLREAVERLLLAQAELDAERVPARLQIVEAQAENHDRRLAGIEQLLIEQLGRDLAQFRHARRPNENSR